MKATIELGNEPTKLFSAVELTPGEIVHYAGYDNDEPFTSENIRFVTVDGLFDVDGFNVANKENTTSLYTRYPTGTIIKLEV